MVIISSTEAVGVKIDSTVTSHLNAIKNHSFNKNQILLAAQLNNDSLYELCDTSYIDNSLITPQSHLSSSPLHSVSNIRGRLPSLLQSVENLNTSAQAATVGAKPPLSISHGYTGSKFAHTANCRSQKQRIHDEALTLRLSTKTSCILPDLSATFEAPQQF